MTLLQFRAGYQEFGSIRDSLVVAKLDEAASRLNADSFGNGYDAAHGLLAAHLLYSSPFGATLRAEGEDTEKKSRYLLEFERVRREFVLPMIVT